MIYSYFCIQNVYHWWVLISLMDDVFFILILYSMYIHVFLLRIYIYIYTSINVNIFLQKR